MLSRLKKSYFSLSFVTIFCVLTKILFIKTFFQGKLIHDFLLMNKYKKQVLTVNFLRILKNNQEIFLWFQFNFKVFKNRNVAILRVQYELEI